MLCAVITL